MNSEEKDFTATLLVQQSPELVFQTLLDVRAWWSGLFDESFEGYAEKVGDEFTFLAGGGAHYSRQKLIEAVPNKKVVWQVTESNLTFVDKANEWDGTRISFQISEQDDLTKIVFRHLGLVPEFQCYDSCAPAWNAYVQDRLKHALTHRNENK